MPPRLRRRLLLSTAPVRRCSGAAAPARDVAITEVTDDGVAIITIDCQGEKMNTLNTRLNKDFEEVLGRLQNDSAIKAAVLISGKPGVFVAGADITMLVRPSAGLAARRTVALWVLRARTSGCGCATTNLSEALTDAPTDTCCLTACVCSMPLARLRDAQDKCRSAEELTALSKGGQEMLQRLEDLKTPVVAAIDGACLGGGLELAMAWCVGHANSPGPAALSHLVNACLEQQPLPHRRQQLEDRAGRPRGEARPAAGCRRHPAPAQAGGYPAGSPAGTDRQDAEARQVRHGSRCTRSARVCSTNPCVPFPMSCLPHHVGAPPLCVRPSLKPGGRARAKRAGLVHGVADPFALRHAAIQAARGLIDGSVKATVRPWLSPRQCWRACAHVPHRCNPAPA